MSEPDTPLPDWRTFDPAAERSSRMTPVGLPRYLEALRQSRRVIAVEPGTYRGIDMRKGAVFELDRASEYDVHDSACRWMRKVHERPFVTGGPWAQLNYWNEYSDFDEGRGTRCPGNAQQIESAAFRAWFGDSQIVDDDGKPVVVFKGVYGPDFSAFERRRKIGIMATNCTVKADAMAMRTIVSPAEWGPLDPNRRQQRLLPLFARVARPFVWDPARWCAWARYGANWFALQDAQRRELEEDGYDGIICAAGAEKFFICCVFDPRQLKSAIANRGTFDDSANICE